MFRSFKDHTAIIADLQSDEILLWQINHQRDWSPIRNFVVNIVVAVIIATIWLSLLIMIFSSTNDSGFPMFFITQITNLLLIIYVMIFAIPSLIRDFWRQHRKHYISHLNGRVIAISNYRLWVHTGNKLQIWDWNDMSLEQVEALFRHYKKLFQQSHHPVQKQRIDSNKPKRKNNELIDHITEQLNSFDRRDEFALANALEMNLVTDHEKVFDSSAIDTSSSHQQIG